MADIPVDGEGRPITSGPLSAGYQAIPQAIGISNYDRRPPFSYWVIQRMLQDDQVSLAIKAAKSPVRKATVVVRSANPEIREYVAQTLANVWRSGMEKLLSCYEFGYSAAEVLWARKGQTIVYRGLKDFHPADVRPLSFDGKFVGFRVRGGLNKWTDLQQKRAGEGKRPMSGHLDLLGCRGIWATHGAHHGNLFGVSRLFPAYPAWDAKWTKGGAIESLHKWYFRYAFHGLVIRYPVRDFGYQNSGGTTTLLSGRDLAREIGDNYRNGSSISLPNTTDPTTGQKEWEVEFPAASAPQHNMLEWVADLDKRIARGIGIFPELMEASDSTGALAGRRVPERAFYASEEGRLWELLEAVREQIVNPGLSMSFGPAAVQEYDIAEVILAPKQDGGEGGGEDGGGEEASEPQPGPLPGGVRLSRNDIACCGGRLIRQTTASLGLFRSRHRRPADMTNYDTVSQFAWSAAKKLLKLLGLRLIATAGKYWFGDRNRLERRLAAVSRTLLGRLVAALWQSIAGSYLAGASEAAQSLDAEQTGDATPRAIADRLHGNPAESGPPPAAPPADGTGDHIPPDVPTDELLAELLGDDPELVFPGLNAAVDNIRRRVPLTRQDFDALGETARQAAFTVAGLDDEAAVAAVQGALAEALAEGASLEAFTQRVQDVPFLNQHHLETVFRTNTMSAFAAGQQDLMRHPVITETFPYVAYDATLDTRVRPTHAAMMYGGIPINGAPSNIYRSDDPIWDVWLPPNGFSCRCRVTYLTIKQAARRGVEEAIKWLATGEPPAEPFRAKIDAQPDAGFATRPAVGPPAVALSMLSGKRPKWDKDGTRWVTIGGEPNPETGAQHEGGFPVQINKEGEIIKGRGAGGNVKDIGKNLKAGKETETQGSDGKTKDDAPQEPPPKKRYTPSGAAGLALAAEHQAAIRHGDADAADIRAMFEQHLRNREALKADLAKKTIAELKRMAGNPLYSDAKKSDYVTNVLSAIDMQYHLKGPLSYGMDGKLPAIKKAIATLTDDEVAEYRDNVKAAEQERAERRDKHQKAITNPETLEEFQMFAKVKGEAALTPEQRAAYDSLQGITRRAVEAEKKASVSGVSAATGDIGIVEGHHTKRNQPTFTVTIAERLGEDKFSEAAGKAKAMGGSYVNARVAKAYGATPGFQFFSKESAEKFAAVMKGEAADISAETAATAEAKQAGAAGKLKASAAAMRERAEEELGRERQTNTARRAGMAESIEARARADIAKAKTAEAIAEAIDSGKATHLAGVSAMTHLETLERALHLAKHSRWREENAKSRVSYEDFMAQPHSEHDAANAAFPYPSLWTHEIKDIVKEAGDEPGVKRALAKLAAAAEAETAVKFQGTVGGVKAVGGRVLQIGEGMPDAIKAHVGDKGVRVHASRDLRLANRFKEHNGPFYTADKGKTWGTKPEYAITGAFQLGNELDLVDLPGHERAVLTDKGDIAAMATAARRLSRKADPKLRRIGETLAGELASYNRMMAMDIKTPAELRAALREYLPLAQRTEKEDPVRKMERDLVGRKIPGFFPTPPALIDRMLSAADIQPGMSVLEPSAGKGDILDAVREAHPEAKTTGIEVNPSLRDIVAAKGHGVADDHDFLEHHGTYDRIVMNPPFEDRQDVAHVRHAFAKLNPGGRLVAVMSAGPFGGSSAKDKDFQSWLDSVGGHVEDLPDGSFAGADAFRKTGVNTKMVVIEKPHGRSHSERLHEATKPNELTLFRDLRKHPHFAHMTKEEFDAAMIEAGSRQPFTLHGHDHPMLRPEEEREAMVKGANDKPGAREYYVGISRRDKGGA